MDFFDALLGFMVLRVLEYAAFIAIPLCLIAVWWLISTAGRLLGLR